jgi:peptidoglycan biosynthesis protein MviN/MurJ (putative lipid II flippase)
MLYAGLRRARAYEPGPGWKALFVRVGVATVAMTVFLVWLLGAAGDWLQMTTWIRITWLAAAVGGGAAVYFAVGWLAGLRPADLRMS